MGPQSRTYPFRRWLALLLLGALDGSAMRGTAQLGNIPAGIIQTTASPVVLPSAVAYDATGNLYIAEAGNHVVRRLDVQGKLTTVAGSGVQGFDGDGGAAVAARLDSPQGLAVAAGVLYISDTHNQRIRRVDLSTGLIATLAGSGAAGFSGDGGPASLALLRDPTALAVDGQGNLYVADTASHRIRRISPGSVIVTVAGTGVQGYSGDAGLAVQARIDSPTGLATDVRGNLYLSDTHNHRVRRIDVLTGVIFTIAGTGGVGRGGDGAAAIGAQLALPHGLSVDADGNVYLSDTANHRIRRIDAVTGIMTTMAGTGTQGFSGDLGQAAAAALDSPGGVAFIAGQVSLTDTGNMRVRAVTVPASSLADFTLTATGSTIQTISSGSTATFTFMAQAQPSLRSGIALAASGLPAGAKASFNPNTLPGAGATTNFVLTIATTKGVAAGPPRRRTVTSGIVTLAFALPFFWIGRDVRRKVSAVCWMLMLGLVISAVGCGNFIVPGTPQAVISVVGTAAGPDGAAITHSAAVTLMQTLP